MAMEGTRKITPTESQGVNPFHRQPPLEPAKTLFTRQELHQFLDRMNPITVPGEEKGRTIDTQA